MLRSAKHAAVLAAGLGIFSIDSAQAATDPGDIAYWQSVQNSKNPQEYKAYLGAFPHGAFAGLAQERIREFSGNHPVAANPAPIATPAAQAGGGVVGKGIITLDPATPQVGDQIKLTFTKFPHLTGYEMVVVYAAGTPDTESQNALFYTFLSDQSVASGISCGPFAPGNYEVRWLTRLYNNKSLYQVGARTAFSVAN